MSAVEKSTPPSKTITIDPPYFVNRNLLLNPCLVPKVNPGSILISPVYTCVRDSWPYTKYHMSTPLSNWRVSSTTNHSAQEANSKLFNPLRPQTTTPCNPTTTYTHKVQYPSKLIGGVKLSPTQYKTLYHELIQSTPNPVLKYAF